MKLFTLLDIVAIVLATIHFGTPLSYYFYIRLSTLTNHGTSSSTPTTSPRSQSSYPHITKLN